MDVLGVILGLLNVRSRPRLDDDDDDEEEEEEDAEDAVVALELEEALRPMVDGVDEVAIWSNKSSLLVHLLEG